MTDYKNEVVLNSLFYAFFLTLSGLLLTPFCGWVIQILFRVFNGSGLFFWLIPFYVSCVISLILFGKAFTVFLTQYRIFRKGFFVYFGFYNSDFTSKIHGYYDKFSVENLIDYKIKNTVFSNFFHRYNLILEFNNSKIITIYNIKEDNINMALSLLNKLKNQTI